ncbi:type I-E CRISPR-associated protein Cas6/Cse3/CasE [uncultured Flavonifractor sp.]|uniref:type I-E CRISPR-associated protein Cas6/Cse3/CasE n=1 Tax=uncultured Flavonifractor sp. TaxID=1193534 RepID=UPI00260FC13F|nr:type I-E CRISPR-associated protein Cas6/Cse3/CasE [uncultured Flavonifractor sp.]
MYLTRMELDVGKRDTRKALLSPSLFHGAIESSFPGERERRLWRVDEYQGKYYLLLLSEQTPDLSHMAKQFGMEENDQPWQTKSYDTLLERIQDGSAWQFRLTANPTKSIKSSEPGKRGMVCAHMTPEYQLKWLLDRCETHGFSIDPEEVIVAKSQWQRFYKGDQRKRPVSLLSVTFEGILTVIDEVRFRQTLVEGIGRGKAFGLGLLTVIRLRGSDHK